MPSSISSGPATKPPDQPVAAHPASTSSTDLASSLPAPIVRLLILLARPIAFLRISIEVLSWKAGRRVESWMVVGAWWGICLGARHAFKYLLPIAVFLPLLPLDRLRLPHVSQNTKKPPPPESTPSQPSTQDTLLHTLSDLHAIYALLPPSPSTQVQDLYVRFANLGNTRLVRGLVIIWSTWVVLGYIVGVRALLAMIGSIILLLPSPAFAHLHHHLSKSLFVRRGLALVFLLTFGSPPEQSIQFDLSFSVTDWVKGKWAASRRPSLALSFRPKVEPPASGKQGEAAEEEKDDVQAGEPIYFRFELHENQRWWMGLDWTSALLPQERPSWCDSHLLPASPPPSFPLPASSSITLPSPTPSDPESKVIRTATWKWLDDDWSIVRAGPGQNASPSISAPATIPTQSSTTEGYNVTASPARPSSASFGHSPDDSSLGPTARAQSIAEQAFTKGLERLKARTTATPATSSVKAGSPRSSIEISRGRSESQASEDMVAVLEHAEGKAGVASVGPIGGGETIVERDDATDMDGWVYGDNKWENMGPKGGLGRFTRRRRWQRRAICSETIQRIHSTPIQTQSSIPEKTDPSISESTEKPSPTLVTPLKAKPTPSTAESALSAIARRERSLSPTKERRPSSSLSNDRIEDAGMLIGATSPGAARDDVLRQRLKKAMGSVGG